MQPMKLYSTSEYRSSKEWPYAVSAGCVVYRMTRGKLEILLLRRAAGHFKNLQDSRSDTYHLPKGHLHIGKTLEETALRETEEEAGVVVELETYLGACTNAYYDFDMNLEKTIHYFAGRWLKDLPSMDGEHSDKRWVTLGETKKLLGTKNRKREDLIVARLKGFLELTHAA